jgi:hypothetical protein
VIITLVVMAYPQQTSKCAGDKKISLAKLVSAPGIKVILGEPEKRCACTIFKKI